MSAPSSISSSEPTEPVQGAGAFLRRLVACVVLVAGLALCFVLASDPYGISPLRLSAAGFNEIKPKRLDIDRQIKPIEVWQKQPRTVFMGTSRIHQSMDPALLDGTPMAPAYNASIPANSLGMNIAHLEQYLDTNKQLKTVFAELFMYNFFGQAQIRTPRPWREAVTDAAALTLSSDAVWDGFTTALYNLSRKTPAYSIAPGGYFVYPPGHNAKPSYEMFAVGIWAMQPKPPESLRLHDETFATVQELVGIARARGVELAFIATPNHAYFDYFIDYIQGWPMVEDWLKRLTTITPVLSFSQPNAWTYETVGSTMAHWYDPFHFSLTLGRAMTQVLAGRQPAGAPSNFAVRLTPDIVAAHVDERRRAIREWAKGEPEFVAAFEKAHRDWLTANPVKAQ